MDIMALGFSAATASGSDLHSNLSSTLAASSLLVPEFTHGLLDIPSDAPG
jgi:hypothetical protein